MALCALVALALSGALLAWRLHSAPLTLPDVARDWLTTRLQPPSGNLTIDSAALYWPRVGGPLYVQVGGLNLAQTEGRTLHLPDMGLALSLSPLVLGQIRARGLVLTDPEVTLVASRSGVLALELGGEGGAAAIAIPKGDWDLTTLRESLPPALRRLDYVQIRGGRVEARYADGAREIMWTAPLLDARLARSERGLVLEAETTSVPHAKIQAAWEASTGKARAGVEASGLSPAALWVAWPGLPRPAVPLPPLSLKARLAWHPEEKRAALEVFNVTDGDVTVRVSGTLAQQGAGGWGGYVEGQLDALEQARLAEAWPHALRYGPAWEWLGQNLSQGTFKDITARTDVSIGPEGLRATGATAEFAFTDMTADYRAPLAPVEGANGTGRLDARAQTLTLDMTEGARVGGLTLGPAHLAVDHILTVGVGRARFSTPLAGALSALGRYLVPEPINAGRYVPLDPSALVGNVALDIVLDLPTQPGARVEGIDVVASGKVTEASIPNAVGRADLTQAALDVTLKDWLLTLKGQGHLANAPVVFTREAALQPAAVKAAGFAIRTKTDLTLSEELRAALRLDLEPYVTVPARLEVTETRAQDKSGRAEVTADLAPSGLAIPPLGYAKPPGAPASATLSAHFAPGGVLSEVRDLSVAGPDLSLKGVRMVFVEDGQHLEALTAPDAVVGQTMASLTYKAAVGGRHTLTLEGHVVDATTFLSGAPSSEQAAPEDSPLDITLSAQTLITGPGRALGPISLAAAREASGRLSRLGMRAETRPGTLEINYSKGTLTLTATNAGAALATFGYAGVTGGTARIEGNADPTGTVRGNALMEAFTARRAPVLAKLLGAMSLTGLLNALNGKGLAFSRLETDFTWAWRPGGALLSLSDGRSSGNALGLTFGGTHNRATDALDLTGTVVLLSGLSGLVGKIPVIGTIVTGGGSGVFAATYTIRGSLAAPEVSVNPLSVLAPGVLRQILFQP
ncbi:MAG: hypothetical protein JKP92_03355 [Alphaproteobacteria bacterium]|nr:hypothetical protein [Alphaproteobacteria bacterium]